MKRASHGALLLVAAFAAGCRGDDAAAARAATDDDHGTLEAAIDPAAQRVAGRHGEVRFTVERRGEAGARARFWIDGGPEVETEIAGPRRGELLWRGRRLRGGPPLPPADVAALDELRRSPLAAALERIPLDLACRPGAGRLDPALGAALLLPWQMVLGYATADVPAAVRDSAARSTCEYFRPPTRASESRLATAPAIVELGFEQPLPMAAGYVPFELASRASP